MMTTRLIADFDNTLNDALNGAVEAEAALGRMYRAALARAEAAEALATDADRGAEDTLLALKHFRARVAELEAQLAAQGWRPVTEKPEPDQKVEIIIEATFDGYGRKGWTTGGFYFNADFPTGWRPLPPAPQEPTP